MSEGGKIQISLTAGQITTPMLDALDIEVRPVGVRGALATFSSRCCGEENGSSFRVHIWGRDLARCDDFPTGIGYGAGGAFLDSGGRSCRSGSSSGTGDGLSWSRPRGQTDSSTSTTGTHPGSTVPVLRAIVSAFGILWLLKFIILNRSFAQIAVIEPEAELRSGPRAEVRFADAGQVGPRVRTDRDHVRGKNR